MNRGFKSHYEILGAPPRASLQEIKEAFRKQSMLCHPDRNGNTALSNEIYRAVLNSYRILSHPERRAEYDSFLMTSSWIQSHRDAPKNRAVLGAPGTIDKSFYLQQINMILWEIEDILDSGIISRIQMRMMLIILTFLDRWVLHPAGFPDYFMEARKMGQTDPRVYIDLLCSPSSGTAHLPYSTLDEYFYDIRRRSGRLLDRMDRQSSEGAVLEGLEEAVLEFSNMAVHYLSAIRDEGRESEPYLFENPLYRYRGYDFRAEQPGPTSERS